MSKNSLQPVWFGNFIPLPICLRMRLKIGIIPDLWAQSLKTRNGVSVWQPFLKTLLSSTNLCLLMFKLKFEYFHDSTM